MAFVDRANFPSLIRPEAHQHHGSELVKGSVTADQLAADSVGASEIAAGAVGTSELADASVTAAKLASEAWTAYTPALTAVTTNPTLGTDSQVQGRYVRAGRTIHGFAGIQFGTSGAAAGTGTYRISLPVAATLPARPAPIGSGWLYDQSANLTHLIVPYVETGFGTYCQLLIAPGIVVAEAVPWVWANNDELRISFTYEAVS